MKALITGSSGLVGSEAVRFLCNKGWEVWGIDNDTRAYLFGPEASTFPERVRLEKEFPKLFHPSKSDITIKNDIEKIFKNNGPFDFIIHCAAQPAHEWSTNNALEDFKINAWGTMVILEHYRQHSPKAIFIQCSSSKVYGDSVNTLPLVEYATRFDLPSDHPYFEGVDEDFGRLDGKLHSLFGASKACGDIMAGEYGKYFNLPIAIFRPVCITGKAHKGAKLHGYLAYLVKCIATGEKYTINGYLGKQVRDNIHASDLVSAFWEVFQDPSGSFGEAYNIGGGRASNNSILEAIAQAEELLGKKGNIEYSDQTRRGDHQFCLYSSSKFKAKYPNWKLTYDNDRIMEELCLIYK